MGGIILTVRRKVLRQKFQGGHETMNKKILTLVLALVMVLGTFGMAFAEVEVEKVTNPKVQWLIDKGIVEGRLQDDGETKVFDLDKTITREEVTKLVIFHRGSEKLARALQGTKGNYTDVDTGRWSNGFINAATVEDLVEGYPDKSFGPERDITYAEIAAILVRMDSRWTAADEKNADWPLSYIKAAEDFGILKDVKIGDANEAAVREKVFEMMYNAFDGKYQAPIVNDKMGVISRVWADSIEINGDDEYTITKDTIFIGDSLRVLYNAQDLRGALVRLAIDDDNEVSHVVVLGNNKIAQPIGKWVGIAEGGVIKDEAPAANLTEANKDEVVFEGGRKLVINDKTRFFVADVEKGNYFEAEKLTDAIDTDKDEHLEGVYAAFDVQSVTDVEYARVIVFSAGKEPKDSKDLRRITESVRGNYLFKAEDTKANETEYSIKEYESAFPFNHEFERMDVVELVRTGETGVKRAVMKIDYSEDPVFKVTDIGDIRYHADGTVSFRGDEIELEDKNGTTNTYALDLDGVNVFTHGLAEGAHVQVHFDDDDNRVIDIVSKVDRGLKGTLPEGTPANEICGKILNLVPNHDGTYLTVTLELKDEPAYLPKVYRILAEELLLVVDPDNEFDGITDEATLIAAIQAAGIQDVEICGLIQENTNEGGLLPLLAVTKLDADYVARLEQCDNDATAMIQLVTDADGISNDANEVVEDADEDLLALARKIRDEYNGLSDCAKAIVDEDTAAKDKIDAIIAQLEDIDDAETPEEVRAATIAAINKLKAGFEDVLKDDEVEDDATLQTALNDLLTTEEQGLVDITASNIDTTENQATLSIKVASPNQDLNETKTVTYPVEG